MLPGDRNAKRLPRAAKRNSGCVTDLFSEPLFMSSSRSGSVIDDEDRIACAFPGSTRWASIEVRAKSTSGPAEASRRVLIGSNPSSSVPRRAFTPAR